MNFSSRVYLFDIYIYRPVLKKSVPIVCCMSYLKQFIYSLIQVDYTRDPTFSPFIRSLTCTLTQQKMKKHI